MRALQMGLAITGYTLVFSECLCVFVCFLSRFYFLLLYVCLCLKIYLVHPVIFCYVYQVYIIYIIIYIIYERQLTALHQTAVRKQLNSDRNIGCLKFHANMLIRKLKHV